MDFADSFHAAMRRCALHPDHPVPDHAQDDAEDAIAFMRKAQLIRESESDNSNGTSTAEETSDTQEQPQ